jgi:DNA-binding NarL/FixJ family response regulator
MDRARVLLAEDFQAVAEELRRVLESEFDVIATVEDGCALVSAAQSLRPDVIVTDISMPRLDGLTAAAQVMRADRAARIVFVTVHGEPAMVQRAFDLGALGYVLKLAAGDDLLPAVRAAMRGERHVSSLLQADLPQTKGSLKNGD